MDEENINEGRKEGKGKKEEDRVKRGKMERR